MLYLSKSSTIDTLSEDKRTSVDKQETQVRIQQKSELTVSLVEMAGRKKWQAIKASSTVALTGVLISPTTATTTSVCLSDAGQN